MDIQVLASSSKGNCIHISAPAGDLLLDAGLPWKLVRERLHFQTSNLAGILITHQHLDHCRAAKDSSPTPLYSSQETFDALGLSVHRVHTVRPLESFRVGSWTVLPFDTIHDCPGSLGFVLASRDAKVLYLTDSAYCKFTFVGITHFIVEINYDRESLLNSDIDDALKRRIKRNHFSLENAVQFFKANDLSKTEEIWVSHMSNDNANEALIKRTIQQVTGKPVYVAQE